MYLFVINNTYFIFFIEKLFFSLPQQKQTNMEIKKIVFVVLFIINMLACVYHCIVIFRNRVIRDKEYLKGFDDGCKWTIDTVKKINSGK